MLEHLGDIRHRPIENSVVRSGANAMLRKDGHQIRVLTTSNIYD
jgi:hypothetical protein